MKAIRLPLLLLAPLLATALSGCLGTSRLSVFSITFTSNYSATIKGVEKAVVCDNKITEVTYGFSYNGKLAKWESELVGDRTGERKGKIERNSSSGGVTVSNGKVSVVYTIAPAGAPLDAGQVHAQSTASSAITPQAIVVVPNPMVIGGISLDLKVIDDVGDSASGNFGGIPVVNNCP
jgi:hypothetical protein